MNVGVDATCWQNNRGFGRHARALLSALVRLDAANHYTFIMDSVENSETVPLEAEVQVVPASRSTAIAASASGRRSARDMWQISRAMSSPDFDLLLFPTVYSYVPVFSRAKKVVMIHDVTAEKYPHLVLHSRAAHILWKIKVALGRWQADAIATVSEYSRRGIAEHFKIPPERIFVVGEASDPIFRVLDNPLPTPRLDSLDITANGRSVIYVGGFSPHKNLEALVAVFAKLASQMAFSNARLIMVGEYEREIFHSCFKAIKKQVEELGIADRVIFTGYLPDEDLVVLLNLSTVLVLPSLIEGFGLPAVEAAACGCPVITTTASPLPTLLGDGGLYFDPAKHEDLELALARVLESESLHRRMREAGLAAARRLTWDAAAKQMISLMQNVITQ
ncbi:MAG TPA: glycosyltransferase family 1 protein [Abditibacteriaceae bacterium]|nr:glycosyltransferase family 1 protein [Abditibacteriaceae bacterium]